MKSINENKATRFFGILLMTATLCSCDSSLRSALDSAGQNRGELEKVIQHYRQNAGSDADGSLKLDAALFLIKNMPGHTSMVGDYTAYCHSLDSVLSDSGLHGQDLDDAIGSVYRSYSGRISYAPTETVISSDYLIDNIEQAFNLWKSGSWAEHLDFELFCEYLLPFACTESQPLDDWRGKMAPFARAGIDELGECYDYRNYPTIAVSTVNGNVKRMMTKMSGAYQTPEIPVYDPNLFVRYPHPFPCNETSDMANLVMRSKGLPVAVDFTPQWPDGHNGHFWTVLWSTHGKAETFSPFWAPLGVPFISHRRFAKVFRRTYAPDRSYGDFLKRNRGMQDFIGNCFFKDVTEEYTATSDISVKLNHKVKGRDVCIAVFDNNSWHPVWKGLVRGSKARFENMGRDVTYIVMAPFHRSLMPVSLPFRLDRLGNIRYLGKNDSTADIHITRKYPLRRHICNLHTIGNGIVEASNDLRVWDTISVIGRYPLTSDVLCYEQPEEYRYWRYSASGSVTSDIAEMYYYGPEDSIPRHDFQLIGADSGFGQMYDGDPLTFYSTKGGKNGGTVDFGKATGISRIEYINRGDGNAITPGHEYRISCWDNNGWNLIKECIAGDVFIDIKDAPCGCLYYVEDLTEGEDNRIFCWDRENSSLIWL